ncbi:kinase-like domain-containing protein [Polychytrium aggregatum]|uniref:kinase-like domain-containing protein n=1 Tax=Polychytrium aggregatum TaxID=110093 RepID=UPI0022FE9374|nr:kinase-like domain-containing protein [Polychytrium aggregatum]KAI9204386.1 kinase-like domain-containing protein [Polychytrium aggregatum]
MAVCTSSPALRRFISTSTESLNMSAIASVSSNVASVPSVTFTASPSSLHAVPIIIPAATAQAQRDSISEHLNPLLSHICAWSHPTSAQLHTFAVPAGITVSQYHLRNYPLPSSLTEKYELCWEIGSGSSGFVLRGIRIWDNMPVAIKFIFKDRIAIDNIARGMPREIFIHKKLNHPGIVRILDVLQDDKFYFIVTEVHGVPSYNPYVNSNEPAMSPDLFEFIKRHPTLEEEQIRFIFRQLAEVVRYLQQEINVVHGDIKDENIVIDNNLIVKLIDFGGARHIPRTRAGWTRAEDYLGTIRYAPPEILNGEEFRGPEVEMWSLGVVLYKLTFGVHPFPDSTSALEGRAKMDWVTRSPELLDLISRLLDVDLHSRATIKEVMNHPFLTMHHESAAPTKAVLI